jgi:hypothetical protein
VTLADAAKEEAIQSLTRRIMYMIILTIMYIPMIPIIHMTTPIPTDMNMSMNE